MKKFFSYFLMCALCATSLTFVSCGDSNNDTELTGIDLLIDQGVLYGKLDHDVTLDSDVTYTLTGTFSVEDGATLTIPAGTRIEATEGYASYIIVAQGGKIYINGTESNPVVMTADDEDNASSGYWGGLILNGKAPISGTTTGTTATCEMNSSYTYGGTDAADNSGSITYLIQKYAGARSSADVEHNGLTLDAVGTGTTISNIFIYENADDGIECFGGTVNVSNVLVVNEDDDMFDNTQGYTGTWTNFYGIWESGYTSTEDDPRGIESDGNFDGKTPDDVGQTDFTVTNLTIDLKLDYADAAATTMMDVIKIRRGAKATITNALVKGTGCVTDLIDCTDSKGDAAAGTNISIYNNLTNAVTGTTISKVGENSATLSTNTSSTGCSSSIFSWTGYSNF